jgi:hypothetical protein
MADINIERKGNSIWPWVVGLLLLAVVVFVVLQYVKGRSNDIVNAPVDSAAVQQAPAYQPAAPPSSTDTIAGDTAHTDSIRGTTTSSQ